MRITDITLMTKELVKVLNETQRSIYNFLKHRKSLEYLKKELKNYV